MSEPYIGEIRIFAGNFAPRGWAYCDGQLLQVSQADALFSLLGTIYGGDGRTTFGLPDLRGRIPLHAGSGPGLTPRSQGQKFGSETATVSVSQLPSHRHNFQASGNFAGDTSPAGNTLATSTGTNLYGAPGTNRQMSADSITASGGAGQAHSNVMPFQCAHYIIALVGVYPSRN